MEKSIQEKLKSLLGKSQFAVKYELLTEEEAIRIANENNYALHSTTQKTNENFKSYTFYKKEHEPDLSDARLTARLTGYHKKIV